jgi:uncharacterized cupin superfamily protein
LDAEEDLMDEAPLRDTDSGRAPAGGGWFTVNVKDAAWVQNEVFGTACIFEGEPEFDQIGYTLCVLQPGQPNGMYHGETEQEDFLVLAGECVLLIEEQERRLKAWDFVHCPPGTAHIFVGAGEGPCAVFMAGGRREGSGLLYPRSAVALQHGAGVEQDTRTPAEAYAASPKWRPWPRAERAGSAAAQLGLFGS